MPSQKRPREMILVSDVANTPFAVFRASMERSVFASIPGGYGANVAMHPLWNGALAGAAAHSGSLNALAVLSIVLTCVGAVVGYVDPGPLTGLLLPLGLTLWLLVGYLGGRQRAAASS